MNSRLAFTMSAREPGAARVANIAADGRDDAMCCCGHPSSYIYIHRYISHLCVVEEASPSVPPNFYAREQLVCCIRIWRAWHNVVAVVERFREKSCVILEKSKSHSRLFSFLSLSLAFRLVCRILLFFRACDDLSLPKFRELIYGNRLSLSPLSLTAECAHRLRS